jgi:hypothetical protein
MMKKDIVRKLCSRKFWFAVAGFVTGLLTTLKVDAQLVEEIGGLIMMGASVIAYIVGEGLADAANAKPEAQVVFIPDEPPDTENDLSE